MAVPAFASIDEIIENRVYLGNLTAALSLECRKKLGITHVLSVCPEYPSIPEDRNHLNIPVQDSEYEDLLKHIPKACCFIQQALDDGGRILVHCVMGVSRSATVVCAFLMLTQQMTVAQATAFTKKRRPQIHPNYGFIKQLQAYEACGYDPSPSNPAYRAWKRRRIQEVTHFLNAVSDTTSIIPNKLYMSNEFPEDSGEAESLLQDMGITHIISLSPAQLQLPPNVTSSITHRHVNIPAYEPEALLLALPQICQFISEGINSGGEVLVHCVIESRACIVVSAYLMYSRNLCAAEAYASVEAALPLFNPSAVFHKQLQVFECCKYKPSPSHPSVKAWVAEVSSSQPTAINTPSSAATAALLNATAHRFLSDTKHDIGAFNETLKNIQQSVMT